MTESGELIKYLLPALGVLLTLLIPKVWDWWRESSKNRHENRKIIKKSLFRLLRTVSVLSECEFYITVKGCKIDYGIYIFVGSMPDQNKADALMSVIMKQYRQVLDQAKNDSEITCNELSTVEPLIANQLSLLSIDPIHATEDIKRNFKLPFSMGNVLSEIKDYRERIENSCNQLGLLLDRNTQKNTNALIENLKNETEKKIAEFDNPKEKSESKEFKESGEVNLSNSLE